MWAAGAQSAATGGPRTRRAAEAAVRGAGNGPGLALLTGGAAAAATSRRRRHAGAG